MSRMKGRLHLEEIGYAIVDREQVNVDPVSAHAEAVRESVRHMQVGRSIIVGALPGQTAVIRYPRLPDMPYSRIGRSIETEAGQNIPYDLSEVFLDWALLDTVSEGEEKMLKILLVAAKHSVIESRVQIIDAAELQYGILTVDSLAQADAAEACDFLRVGESVALINIGLTSSSIHFTRDGVSNFIRDVNWGAREFIQAIAKAQRCDYEEAEEMLGGVGDSGGEEPSGKGGEAQFELEEDGQTELAEDLDSLDTPTLQEDIGSPLDPLDDELAELETADTGGYGGGMGPDEEQDLDEILGLALGRLVSEVRRSFDYYEHQLYERPVDRLILSGGVAHLPVLQQTLMDELGIDSVEVAAPDNSALLFGDSSSVETLRNRPAQFMVAIGLAARGMAEL